jgi:Rrf2 family cysteine metabolism transcriptional repressor
MIYYVNEFKGFIGVNNVRISTKGRYGLTIMIELAKQFGEGPVPLRQIASDNELSEAYLEQLVSPLRNSGLVKSVRGAHGGYMLSKPPHLISAGDVIRVLEGPIQPVEGIENEPPPQRELWMRIRDAVKTVLDTTTIEDLAAYNNTSSDDGYMFYI